MKHLRRLQLLSGHIHLLKCTYTTPAISVTPSTALVDEKVNIVVCGLKPNQTVTLVATTEENAYKFKSRCVVTTDNHGKIDNYLNPSSAGTFTGIQPMGLFWSLTPNFGVRLMKKDVSIPISYTVNVYNGSHLESSVKEESILASTNVYRLFKKPGVRRIPVKHGKLKGTVFIPEGEGSFPALIDMYGGIVTLIETRAALLASHGYATFALSYLYGEGLPQTLLSADLGYLQEALRWLSKQDYVDEKRLGVFGLCFGGTLALYLASVCPEIKAVVNVNGVSIHGGKLFDQQSYDNNCEWPIASNVYRTEEGVVINEVYDSESPVYLPAWQHGAKVLQISGEDDKQVHPKWHRLYENNWPEEFRSNFELVTYPGAGHLIEPPYTPLCKGVFAGRKRMSTIDFIPSEFHDEPLIAGGNPNQHAFAQEDSWNRILIFLKNNLKHVD